ncbi:TPA: PDDEXK nuclease domain-containing protein [Yersinia enterocolitica]
MLDDYVRELGENPSIGIILCKERDYFEVEYILRGIDKPVGISGYLLTSELPPELRNKRLDPKVLEKEIRREMGELDTFDSDK